jgi:ribosomal protein S17E
LHTAAKKLVAQQPNSFTAIYAENKLKLKELGYLKGSKEEQNKLAGAITVLKKQQTPAETQ